jgi:hypothetical protein
MGVGKWNVRSVCGAALPKTVAREVVKYRLDTTAVQDVRWVECGSQQAIILFYEDGNTNLHLGTEYFVHSSVRSAVERVEFISERISY